MIVYCDTDSLLSNPQWHDNAKAQQEAAAIFHLLDYHRSGKLTMQRSNVGLRELEKTRNPVQRDSLRREFLELVQITNDEKVLGFDNLQTDPFGGFVTNPLVSDVQDERLESAGPERSEYRVRRRAIGCEKRGARTAGIEAFRSEFGGASDERIGNGSDGESARQSGLVDSTIP